MRPANPPGLASAATAAGLFATTHWSLVRLARGDAASPEVAAAREELCRKYWYPIYAHIRRRGHPPADAQDLTQEFFARMLGPHGFTAAKREKGRFRSYTLGALRHFLADAQDRAKALKRGGSRVAWSFEPDVAEARLACEPADAEAPDRLFDRRWAIMLIEHALDRLRNEETAAGRAGAFERLQPHLTGLSEHTCVETAQKLGLSESALKAALHRLRRRYGLVLRDEVAKTVSGPDEVDDEIRHLLRIVAGIRAHD